MELQFNDFTIEFELCGNRANPRDLIAATGLVILVKLDWPSMTLKLYGWIKKKQ